MRDVLSRERSDKSAYRLAELQAFIQPILTDLARTFGFERAFVVLVDMAAGAVQAAIGINTPDDFVESLPTPLDERGPLLQALRSGRPVQVVEALVDPRIRERARLYYTGQGMFAFAVLPLLPVSAVLVIAADRQFQDGEIENLLPYATQLSAAIVEHLEANRERELDRQYAIERDWLWWMVNAVHDPVLLSDEENNILLNNIHADRLLRSNPDDSPGKRRAIDLNNFLLSAALSSFALDQGQSLGRELTLVDPIEGDELLFEVICQPVTHLGTGTRGLVTVLKDVTDLRRAGDEVGRSLVELRAAGEEARAERDRLNLIIENVADPIVVTDPAGEIMLMNQPAERLLQAGNLRTPRNGARDRRTNIYLANDAKLGSFLSQFLLEAAPVAQGEIQFADPGTEDLLTMSITATKVRDGVGRVTAIVSVLHDLTKIRELERRRVEQQLFESQKMAAVGRLAAAVAHEINNPLEAIKNALYLVVSRLPKDDPNRRFLEIADKETQRVSSIIRQMLGFYRPAAVKVLADINRILDEVFILLERQLKQHHVTLRRELDPQLPPVMASPDQLKQVFLNLVLNAQEAMPAGGTLTVSTPLSTERDTEFLAGRYVLIQVRDTGTGIPEEHLPHIFEPFYSTKSESKGTGLGLWVSLGIIQNLRGQIMVRSRPDRGTTFTIVLPVEEERGV